jgi:hypothetical protein
LFSGKIAIPCYESSWQWESLKTSFFNKRRPAAESSGPVFVSLFGQHDAVVGQQSAIEGGVSPVGQQNVLPLVVDGDGLILPGQVADDKQLLLAQIAAVAQNIGILAEQEAGFGSTVY